MRNPLALANALAVVSGGLYLICAVWSYIAKDSFLGIMNTWAHTIDWSALPTRTPDLTSLVIGLITFVAAAWLTGYAFAVVYNNFAHK